MRPEEISKTVAYIEKCIGHFDSRKVIFISGGLAAGRVAIALARHGWCLKVAVSNSIDYDAVSNLQPQALNMKLFNKTISSVLGETDIQYDVIVLSQSAYSQQFLFKKALKPNGLLLQVADL